MSEEKKRPDWMEDDLVKDIPQRKLEFLQKLFAEGHGKNQKEMMAYLIPVMQKARRENLTFTPQEMNAAIAAIKKHSTQEELSQIDKILKEKDRRTKKS